MKDINVDRFCCVVSGTAFFALKGERPIQVPVGFISTAEDAAVRDEHPESYPRDNNMRMHGSMYYGTVDEIVNQLRDNMVKTYRLLANCDEGQDAVIAQLGTADFEPQRAAAIKYYGGDHFQEISLADGSNLNARATRQNELDKFLPRQPPAARTALREIVGLYGLRFSHIEKRSGDRLTMPNNDPKNIMKLIRDLGVFLEDAVTTVAMREDVATTVVKANDTIVITINGDQHRVPAGKISYEQIAELVGSKESLVSVSFWTKNIPVAEGKGYSCIQGTLCPGEFVVGLEGMNFNAYYTGNA